MYFEVPIRNFIHIRENNVSYIAGADGVAGANGAAGADGVAGVAGADGTDGRNGVDGAIVFFNATEYLANLVDNITLLVIDKINDNGILNIREIHSQLLHTTDMVVNIGNFSIVNSNNVNSINVDSIDYTGNRFNRCVSGWC